MARVALGCRTDMSAGLGLRVLRKETTAMTAFTLPIQPGMTHHCRRP